MSDLAVLQTRLGYPFRNAALLQLALTHPSIAHEQGAPVQHKARAKLVNRRTLAGHGRLLGLGEHLILSRGEELNGGRERTSALADAYEALVGAIFMDGGYDAARDFVLREFGAAFGSLAVIPILENPKGELQELLQARSPEAPQYHVVATTGPDHDRVFECTVHHAGVELARGAGKSKKAAESEAALAALEKLRPESNPSAGYEVPRGKGESPAETGNAGATASRG